MRTIVARSPLRWLASFMADEPILILDATATVDSIQVPIDSFDMQGDTIRRHLESGWRMDMMLERCSPPIDRPDSAVTITLHTDRGDRTIPATLVSA